MILKYYYLLQSLSAAHLLTATSIAGIHSHQNAQDLLTSHRHSPPLSSVGSLPQPPPEVEDILLLVSREGTASSSDGEPHRDDGVSTPDIAINAATVFDLMIALINDIDREWITGLIHL